MEATIQALSARVERLERSNRRWRVGALTALTVTTCSLLVGLAPGRLGGVERRAQATQAAGVARATEFLLVSRGGNVRASLWDSAEGPVLTFYNTAGTAVGSVGGDQLTLSGSGGLVQIMGTTLLVRNAQGSPTGTRPGPSIQIRDADGYSAVIGVGDTTTPQNGESQRTSAASIYLFGKPDKDGTSPALWHAPY